MKTCFSWRFSAPRVSYSKVKHEWQITVFWSMRALNWEGISSLRAGMKGAMAPRELPAQAQHSWRWHFCPCLAGIQLMLCLNRLPSDLPKERGYPNFHLSYGWEMPPPWQHIPSIREGLGVRKERGKKMKDSSRFSQKEFKPFTDSLQNIFYLNSFLLKQHYNTPPTMNWFHIPGNLLISFSAPHSFLSIFISNVLTIT